jgi:hypothetical protein
MPFSAKRLFEPTTGARHRARAWALHLFLALWLIAGSVFAASNDAPPASTEDRIKAAFLYKFAAYIEWPQGAFASPQSPIVIGVLGAGSIADALDELTANRTIANRKMIIKRIEIGDSIKGLNILFIGDSERSHLHQLAPQLQAHSVLSVTESEGALEQGSIINFLVLNQRVKFDVSLESAQKSGIKLSSRLLAVAHKVLGVS